MFPFASDGASLLHEFLRAPVALQLDFLFFSVGDYRFAQALACRLPTPDITGK
jgi:hypothetical protein